VSPLLPQVAELLAAALADPPPPPAASVQELRAHSDAGVLRRSHLVRDGGHLHAVRDLTSPGGVPVRLYLPTGADALPLHVHLHGGGWWMGSIETVDPMARELAGAGLAVASVGYRLAPEHPWPAAPEDVFEALSWLGAADLGFAPKSVSIGGESAGANLAAVVSLMARDRGGPRLVAQWLDVPAVDLRLPADGSVEQFGTGFGLEVSQLPMMAAWYADDLDHPYVSPARADLAGLPPTIVTTAECDPLRDQGEGYAAALAAAGVPVELRRASGHIHASSWFTALDEGTAAWHDEVVALLLARHRALEPSA
jgi:acetyl esterase